MIDGVTDSAISRNTMVFWKYQNHPKANVAVDRPPFDTLDLYGRKRHTDSPERMVMASSPRAAFSFILIPAMHALPASALRCAPRGAIKAPKAVAGHILDMMSTCASRGRCVYAKSIKGIPAEHHVANIPHTD